MDIVSIAFGREIDLLALQARSLDRFLDASFSGRIFVIVNDLRRRAVSERIEASVLPLYGRWRDRVTIIPFFAIGHRLSPSNGWVIQQALKLSAAHLIEKPHYVVLDAKNHLVAPVTLDRFVNSHGLARQCFGCGHAHMPRHDETCARFFGLDPDDPTRRRFVPMTPFVLHTQSVRDLVQHIERREKRRLGSIFSGRRLLSEFLLYGAYLDAYGGGTSSLYEDVSIGCVTVWPNHDERAHIAEAETSGAYCFGVHRDHLATIAPSRLQVLQDYWRRVGLLDATETLSELTASAPAGHAFRRTIAPRTAFLAAVLVTATALLGGSPYATAVGFIAATLVFLAAALRWRDHAGNACLVGAALCLATGLISFAATVLRQDIEVAGTSELFDHASPLGWSLRPGVHRSTKTVNGKTIYDVAYTIDGRGHRSTAAARDGGAVAFLGDSFTFGEGVDDAETLPQALSDLTGRHLRVVNLGVPAYSPSQVLRELQLGMYDDVLKPAKLFFLLTAPWHIDRVACLDAFVVGAPRYVVRNGALVLDGACPSPPEPQGVARLVRQTPIYKLLLGGKLPFVGRSEIDAYVRVVAETAHLARSKYGVTLNVLYLRNAGYLRFTGVSDDEIMARMRAAGANVLEMTLPKEGRPGFALQGDGHPNGAGNRLRARMLMTALRETGQVDGQNP